MLLRIFSLFILASCTTIQAQPNQAVELGQVGWLRDYEEALAQAQRLQKPVLLLFQEVPGCATCRNYGQEVLSHPLIVEAIEDCFVPLAIHNNKGGKDREILNLYREPSWNNPVVRLVDDQGVDLVDRVSGNYSAAGLAQAMVEGLEKAGQTVPAYLELLRQELQARQSGQLRQQTYQMYCFWSGEGHLGKAEGVIATQPGFMNGREVVQVFYDPGQIKSAQLEDFAKSGNCKPVSGEAFRPDVDPQYYLKHSDYRYLPLTPLQRTRINSALGDRASGEKYLSPQQKSWLQTLPQRKEKEVLYDQPFEAAWQKAAALME